MFGRHSQRQNLNISTKIQNIPFYAYFGLATYRLNVTFGQTQFYREHSHATFTIHIIAHRVTPQL